MPAHFEQTPKNKIEYLLSLSKPQKINLRLAHLEQTVEKRFRDLLTLSKRLKKDFETCSA